MRKLNLLFLVLLLFSSCTPKKDLTEILKGEIIVKTYPEKAHLDLLNQKNILNLLLFLHNRVSKEEILKELKISEEDYNQSINSLFANGIIKTNEKKEFLPACMVVSKEDEKDIRNFVLTFATDISEIIIEKYPLAQQKYSKLRSFLNISFDEASLFILYNVMLDKWQLDNIVERFLRSDLPNRGGNRSYIIINQKDNDTSMQNIYFLENRCADIDGYKLCSFGNKNHKNNFVDIDQNQLIDDFKMNEVEDEKIFKKKLIDDLIKFSGGNKGTINPNLTLALNKYGLLRDNRLFLPVIDKSDNEILNGIAKLAGDDLIRYFDSKRPVFVKKYLSTTYKEEIGFREWSFWVYKFITEEATKLLINKGYIKSSDRELFYYLEKR